MTSLLRRLLEVASCRQLLSRSSSVACKTILSFKLLAIYSLLGTNDMKQSRLYELRLFISTSGRKAQHSCYQWQMLHWNAPAAASAGGMQNAAERITSTAASL
jgi:hypothetical protein